jgi:phosphoribosylglycinamide formyltransferase-1
MIAQNRDRGGALTARLVVLVSGAGTTLQALLDACQEPAYGARVVAVGADRDGIPALERAGRADVPSFVVRLDDCPDRATFDQRTAAAIAEHAPDLVVCAGYMKLLGAEVLRRFRIVNTHPALLPSFPGAAAVRDALAYGVKVSGVSVHVVDEGVDTGPVLAQVAVPVLDGDDEASLHRRIQAVERGLYVDVVGRIARDGWDAAVGSALRKVVSR